MKTLLTIAIFGAAICIANAQTVKEAEVPGRTMEAFRKQYPNVKVDKWEKEGANYEAEFMVDKVQTTVVYDERGKYIQTEAEMEVSALPPQINEYIEVNLNGKKVTEASKITDAAGTVNYEAEIGETDYLFDSKGTLIKQEMTEDDD